MLRDEINRAIEILQNGGLILYPTDTIWGIGCDATNADAVDKIFKLKGRDSGKSLIVLLENDNKLENYVKEVPAIAYDLIDYAEHPLTIIYSGAKNLAQNAIHSDGSIGIRIVKHDFCQQLIQKFRKPIISTSANLSGSKSPANFNEIQLEIIDGVDYVVAVDQEDHTQKRASTIMKLESDGRFSFVRK